MAVRPGCPFRQHKRVRRVSAHTPALLASIDRICSFWQDDRVGAYRGLVAYPATLNAQRGYVARKTFREVHWAAVAPSPGADRVVAIFTREIHSFNSSNSSASNTAPHHAPIDPLPVIPMCSRKFPPFVLGLCFDAPLVYVGPHALLWSLDRCPGTTASTSLLLPVSLTSTALHCKHRFFLCLQHPSIPLKLSSRTMQHASTSATCSP